MSQKNTFEQKLNSIINNEELFAAEKRVVVMKALAEELCTLSRKRLKKLEESGKDIAKVKEKCIKRKVAELWWTFLRQKEPVRIKNLTVQLSSDGITVKKGE